jgi:hypothetical protein
MEIITILLNVMKRIERTLGVDLKNVNEKGGKISHLHETIKELNGRNNRWKDET